MVKRTIEPIALFKYTHHVLLVASIHKLDTEPQLLPHRESFCFVKSTVATIYDIPFIMHGLRLCNCHPGYS